MLQHAFVTWKGGIKSGRGSISTESGALKNVPFTFSNRFEGEKGSNPEELVAAAHAACFSMALSGELEKSSLKAENIDTSVTLSLDKTDQGWTVTSSRINVEAVVPGIDEAKFQKIAEEVKNTCPISRLLQTEISLDAKLKSNQDARLKSNQSDKSQERAQWNG